MMEIRKLTPGDRILDYRILESIGEGGFGEVFRAEHEVLGRVVAIKVPRDLEALSALRMEGVIQAQLDHPSIVKTLEISISHDPPYVAMEFVDGDSLRRLIEGKGLSWKRAVKILIDVCKALDHAHKQGVIHGDVKPGNILVPSSNDSPIKVTDFGLGRIFDAANNANLQISRSLNFVESASEVVGTLRYLAPEVQRGETPDSSADIYSLGVLLFEMLTGSLPEGREVPSDVKKGVPESLNVLFGQCFARKNRRVKSVEKILKELEFILANDGLSQKEKQDQDEKAAQAIKDKEAAKEAKKQSKKVPVLAVACASKKEAPLCIEPAPAAAPSNRCKPKPTPLFESNSDGLDLDVFSYDAEEHPEFEDYQEDLWSAVRETLLLPEGIEEIDHRGFDLAFGVVNDGDPQHRVFACALPTFNAEAAREFVNHGSKVFDLEKGLWEKEVTFIIAAESVTERDKVDWALRSFSTGWWRRRRVVLYDMSQDRVVARDYGCDPADNELKKAFLEQLRSSNQQIISDRERGLAFAAACRARSSRIGTALTVFSTFCVIAVGLSFQSSKVIKTQTEDVKVKKRKGPAFFQSADPQHPINLGDVKAKAAEDAANDQRDEAKVKLPERTVEDH
ncbi:MAG: serine/threonine-protein kinase [Planctomycetota bacterium]|nr:serine/threonine-protein kinase [Planctomycetota bacterium]